MKKILLIQRVFFSFLLLFLSNNPLSALTIDEAIALSRQNNKQILQQKKQIAIAGQGVKEAKSYSWPQLSLNANYTYYDKEQRINLPGRGSIQMGFHNNYLAGVGVNQLIYDWGKTLNAVDKTRNIVKIEEEKLRYLENQLIFNLKEIFYRLVYLRKNVAVYKESWQTAEENLRSAKEKYRRGKLSRYETVRAGVEAENLKPNILWAENELKMAWADLELLLGTKVNDRLSPEDLPFNFPDEGKEKNLQEALAYNTSLKLLELERAGMANQLKMDAALNKPAVSAFLNYNYLNPFENQEKWENLSSIGVKINFPLFDGLRTAALVEKNRLILEKNVLQKEDTEENIAREVEKAWLDFTQTKQLIVSQEANIQAAELGLQIARTRFQEGLSTQIELLDAQTALQNAQANLHYTRYKTARSYFLLKFLAGGPVGN
ncbi:MAG: TolC family protein [Elusimicrobiota bacterium]